MNKRLRIVPHAEKPLTVRDLEPGTVFSTRRERDNGYMKLNYRHGGELAVAAVLWDPAGSGPGQTALFPDNQPVYVIGTAEVSD